jgi:hypothetical protein
MTHELRHRKGILTTRILSIWLYVVAITPSAAQVGQWIWMSGPSSMKLPSGKMYMGTRDPGESYQAENAAYQQHFLDLCELLGQPKPAQVDGDGTFY